jgi:phage terminase small subunit
MPELNDKVIRFCEEFIIDLNGTQAAIRAGYSAKTAHVQASRLLSYAKVQEKIAELQQLRSKRTEITADMVLKELAYVGFAKITDFLKVSEASIDVEKEDPIGDDDGEDDEDGLPVITERRFFKMVEIFETDKMPPEAIPAIASIKQGVKGIEVKLHDKVKSLELIGRHLGMFPTHVDVTSKGESIAKAPTMQLPDGTTIDI